MTGAAQVLDADGLDAESTGVHNETVGAVRGDLERRDGFRHVSIRTDTLGRRQPATKPHVFVDSAKQSARIGEMAQRGPERDRAALHGLTRVEA